MRVKIYYECTNHDEGWCCTAWDEQAQQWESATPIENLDPTIQHTGRMPPALAREAAARIYGVPISDVEIGDDVQQAI